MAAVDLREHDRRRVREARGAAARVAALLAVAACALGPIGPATAAEPAGESVEPVAEPEETIYATATVRERPVASATAAVTVIERAAIDASGARTVADVLAFVPGLFVESAGTRGGSTVARLRGGDPNFTLVLLDGVPLNDGTYPVGEVFNLETLPASAVERIEVVRGPLSSFYGSTGLAGAIHVVTRTGAGAGPRGEVDLAAGDADRLRVGASAALGGAFVDFVHDEEAGRIARERFELDHLQGRAAFELGEAATLHLAGRAARWRALDYPEASGGPLFGSGELRRGDHEEGSLGAELRLPDRSGRLHKVTLALYRHLAERDSPAIAPLVPPSVEATRFTRARLGWASSWVPASGWSVSVGADLDHEEGETTSLLFLPPAFGGATVGDYALARTSGGLFGEVVAERGPVAVELALRLDAPDGGSLEASPRLGARWRLGDGRTRLRASAGRAFKLPSFFALASPPALGGNPELEPEVMVGGDLGIERAFGAPGGLRATVSLTGFDHRFERLVDFDFATFTHVNRAVVDARGIEAAVDGGAAAGGLAFAAGLTWQEVEDGATGEPLRQRPRWSGGVRLSWRALPRLDLHLDGRHVSSRRDEQLPVPELREVAGYELLGAHAAWRFAPRWRLEVRVDNLLDREYQTLVGFPGAGRSGWLGVRRAFGAAGGDGAS